MKDTDGLGQMLQQILFCKHKLRKRNKKKRVLDADNYRRIIKEMRQKIIATRELQRTRTTVLQ